MQDGLIGKHFESKDKVIKLGVVSGMKKESKSHEEDNYIFIICNTAVSYGHSNSY